MNGQTKLSGESENEINNKENIIFDNINKENIFFKSVYNEKYYDKDTNKYFDRCNFSINSDEYFVSSTNNFEYEGIISTTFFSIPALISSAIVYIIFIIIFIVVGISSYKSHNKNIDVSQRGFFSRIGTLSIIVSILCVICCSSSLIGTIIYIYIEKQYLEDINIAHNNSRPCYSDKQQKIIY
jgi:hypothetical protein